MPTITRIAALAITLGLVTAPLAGCGGSGTASQGGQTASAAETSTTGSATSSTTSSSSGASGFTPSMTSSSSGASAEITAKDAFEPNTELKHGPFTVSIPNYYGQPNTSEDSGIFGYAIGDNSAFAIIYLLGTDQANDTAPKDVAAMGPAIIKGSIGDIDISTVGQADTDINGMKANNLIGIATKDGNTGFFVYSTGIVSNDGKGMALLTLAQTGKDGYNYSSDFMKVVNSVRYDESQAGSSSTSQVQPQEAKPEQSSESDGISPEFKASMDSYEAFFDEYVDFMRRYKEDPTNMELLGELGDMLSREADMIREFDKIEDQDLSSAEMAYYLEVHARIYKKLAEVL